MRPIFTSLFISLLCTLNAQNRFYVDQSASGQDNGQSWGDAFLYLQSALQIAQSGDEVWVAKGVYKPTLGLDRYISFEPASGVRLYGGFSGAESQLAQRDWATNQTLLNGDIGVLGDSLDNSFNVLFLLEPDSTTIIDGFTVMNGNADSASTSDPRSRFRSGGGLYIMGESADAYPVIRNCIFKYNTAFSFGGAVMVNGSNSGSVAPQFVNCQIAENHALASGGGIARFGGSVVERTGDFQDCSFLSNRADLRGGGLYYWDGPGNDQLDVQDCVFTGNVGVQRGGGAYFTLGRGNGAKCALNKCDFIKNESADGGAIRTFPLGFAITSIFSIDSSNFEDNKYLPPSGSTSSVILIDLFAEAGSTSSMGSIRNSIIQNNKGWATLLLYSWEESLGIFNSISIINNEGNSVLVLIAGSKNAIFSNSLISSNQLAYGSIGIGLSDRISFNNVVSEGNGSDDYFTSSSLDSLILTNCIFSNNTIEQYNHHTANKPNYIISENSYFSDIKNKLRFFHANIASTISHSAIDTIDCAYLSTFDITCGPGNLFGLNPMFRDTANGDYSLLPCSPLINAGSNAAASGLLTDITGAPRIQEGTVDIGAYESPAFALAATPSIQPACAGAQGGGITISPDFGCEPYTYQWQPAVGNGPEINGLPEGDYAFSVTDARGRVISDTITVGEAPSPALSPLPSDLQCGLVIGGQATVSISSGTAPFSFLWSNAATDSLVTMLPAGQYQVTVTDANGCQDSTEMTISKQGQITLMVNGVPISCFGESDAVLSATPANGKAPFSFLWSQGAMDSLLTGLGPGMYSVTATDFYGCTSAFTYNVESPALLQTVASATPTNNLQTPNGTASVVSVSGGTQAFTYQWSNGSSGLTISGLAPGTYTVTVTDAHGCTASASATVEFMVGAHDIADIQVQVWPNPMRDRLEIQAVGLPSGDWRFVLRDLLGREVAAENLSNGRAVLVTSSLASGMYEWSLMIGTLMQQSGKALK